MRESGRGVSSSFSRYSTSTARATKASRGFRSYAQQVSYSTFQRSNNSRSRWQESFQRAQEHAQSQKRNASYRRQTFNNQRTSTVGGLFKRWAQRPTFYYEVGGLGAAAGAYYIANLETVPVSGRRRFSIVSHETEKQLGKQQYDQLLQQYAGAILPESSREHQQAVRVLQRLIPNAGIDDQDWEVHVIADHEQMNAFVLPGGKVFLYTGILKVTRDDDGLAAVLGHEIAHNVAHHAGERASSMFILLPIGVFAWALLGVDLYVWRMATRLMFEFPSSRKQEEEADYIGLLMMAQSCYDPNAALRLWASMEGEEKGRAPPQFLSTHPSSHNRLEKIRDWIGEAEAKREGSDCGAMVGYTDDFRGAMRKMW